jgi:hypothetical protein
MQERSSGLTTTTAHKGTERYLSPELVSSDIPLPTLEADIYALGCVGLKVSSYDFEAKEAWNKDFC